MVFNDSTSGQGIVQDIYFTVNTNATKYPIADITRNANRALDHVVSLILGSDGRWQFDSTNSTDLPRGRADIISGQQDYSFDDEYLVIKSLEVRDSTGNLHRLQPIDNGDLGVTESLTGYQNTAGLPEKYDKMGKSVLLYPTPNYNMRLVQEGYSGLIAYFQRKIDYFTSSDTTKEPGFAKHLHKIIPLMCSYDYAIAHNLPKAANLKQEILRYEQDIKDFYSYRERDFRNKLSVKQESTR